MSSEFAASWQSRLNHGFPLLAAMQLQVLGDAGHWQLFAPHAPNCNEHGTAFGGSLATLAITAGWMAAVQLAGPDCEVVIQSAHYDYLLPMHGDLFASVTPPTDGQASRFARMLARGRPARLALRVVVTGEGGACAGEFVGQYVARPLSA